MRISWNKNSCLKTRIITSEFRRLKYLIFYELQSNETLRQKSLNFKNWGNTRYAPFLSELTCFRLKTYLCYCYYKIS